MEVEVKSNEELAVENRLLMLPSEVVSLAWAEGEYVDLRLIASGVMWDVQRRYITPIVGEELLVAMLNGVYSDIVDVLVKPAMAMMTRVKLELPAFMASDQERARAKAYLRELTEYLNDHENEIVEYNAAMNIQNHVEMVGGFIL